MEKQISVTKRKILTGIMSILFHLVGVDSFLVGDKDSGFQAIKNFITYYIILIFGICFAVMAKQDVFVLFGIVAILISSICLIVNAIKGITNGVKILKSSDEDFALKIKTKEEDSVQNKDTILSVKGLKVNYGPIQAVKGIDMNVGKGKIVAILGANGAGKTTTLRTISGIIKSSGGTIVFDNENITGKKAFTIASKGLTQSPEGRLVFVGLNVEDNLKAGAYSLKSKKQLKENLARVYRLFPILKERRTQQANTLSGGEQQMLAIGRALMASPKLLLLDEPSLGLAPLIIKDIFNTLIEIKNEGTTILIVEQNALATLKIADYAYVLELGSISLEGPASELINDSRLIDAYLGGKK